MLLVVEVKVVMVGGDISDYGDGDDGSYCGYGGGVCGGDGCNGHNNGDDRVFAINAFLVFVGKMLMTIVMRVVVVVMVLLPLLCGYF